MLWLVNCLKSKTLLFFLEIIVYMCWSKPLICFRSPKSLLTNCIQSPCIILLQQWKSKYFTSFLVLNINWLPYKLLYIIESTSIFKMKSLPYLALVHVLKSPLPILKVNVETLVFKKLSFLIIKLCLANIELLQYIFHCKFFLIFWTSRME